VGRLDHRRIVVPERASQFRCTIAWPWPLARASHRRRYNLATSASRSELEAELRAAVEEGDRNPPRALTTGRAAPPGRDWRVARLIRGLTSAPFRARLAACGVASGRSLIREPVAEHG